MIINPYLVFFSVGYCVINHCRFIILFPQRKQRNVFETEVYAHFSMIIITTKAPNRNIFIIIHNHNEWSWDDRSMALRRNVTGMLLWSGLYLRVFVLRKADVYAIFNWSDFVFPLWHSILYYTVYIWADSYNENIWNIYPVAEMRQSTWRSVCAAENNMAVHGNTVSIFSSHRSQIDECSMKYGLEFGDWSRTGVHM